jgi:hypothetical protein
MHAVLLVCITSQLHRRTQALNQLLLGSQNTFMIRPPPCLLTDETSAHMIPTMDPTMVWPGITYLCTYIPTGQGLMRNTSKGRTWQSVHGPFRWRPRGGLIIALHAMSCAFTQSRLSRCQVASGVERICKESKLVIRLAKRKKKKKDRKKDLENPQDCNMEGEQKDWGFSSSRRL